MTKKNKQIVLSPQKGPQEDFLKKKDDVFLVLFGGGAVKYNRLSAPSTVM